MNLRWFKSSVKKWFDVSESNPLPVTMAGTTINATVNPDVTDRASRRLGIIERIIEDVGAIPVLAADTKPTMASSWRGLCYETDTGKTYYWSGSAWVVKS